MVNLDEFKYGGTNLTAFRLLDPDKPEVQQVVQDWIHGELRFGRKLDVAGQGVKVILSFHFEFALVAQTNNACFKTHVPIP